MPKRPPPKRTKAGTWKKGVSGNPGGIPRARKDAAEAPAPRRDGWSSALTGIGMAGKDKRLASGYDADIVTESEATNLWRADDIAARIVETWPNEMLRQGFDLCIAGDTRSKQLQEEISSRWEDLGLSSALWNALAYERAYGGGAILLGANDGSVDLREPLKMDRIKSLDWLTPLEPREVRPLFYYADPRQPRFGEAEVYQLSVNSPGTAQNAKSIPTSVLVHESRLIVFPGIRVSRRQLPGMNGWGDSVLTRVWSVLRDFNISWGAAGILVHDFAQAVFKVKGLAELIAGDRDEVVAARMKAVELSRSVARAILIDAEEEFERKQTPLTGLPELLDAFATRLAAAADMPLTLLMGQSPGGLNATGESDIRFFYDRVRSAQERKLRPSIERVVKMIFRSLNVEEPESWSIRFHALWQPTDAEAATARLTQAQTDQIYIQNGVLDPTEVAESRFGGDEFNFATQIDLDARGTIVLPEVKVAQLTAASDEPDVEADISGDPP